MDEMKIKSSLMRGLVAKIFTRIIKKNTGVDVKLYINNLDIKIVDDAAYLNLNIDGEMDKQQLRKIVSKIG